MDPTYQPIIGYVNVNGVLYPVTQQSNFQVRTVQIQTTQPAISLPGFGAIQLPSNGSPQALSFLESQGRETTIPKTVTAVSRETPNTKPCYGYTRVSTDIQAEKGISLDNQEHSIRESAARWGYTVIHIFTDKARSGKKREKRPALEEMLRIMKIGDTIIAHSMSRLSRSTKDLIDIRELAISKGVAIRFIKENMNLESNDPSSNLMRGIYAVVGEFESDIARQRVKDVLERKQKNNEFMGRPPYGWKLSNGSGSRLIEVPEQQDVIVHIEFLLKQRDNDGNTYTYNMVAKILNREGITPPVKSKKWYNTTVQRIAERGEVKTKGNILKDPPIAKDHN